MTNGIEDLIARQRFYDLIVTYARAADRGDEALMASVFHPDAEIVTGIIDGKAADYSRGMVRAIRENYSTMFHSLSNTYFEIDGDRAFGEAYVFAMALSKGVEPLETLAGGRYLDRFEKREGIWKIAHRTYVADWRITRPASPAKSALDQSGPQRGGFAPNDPSLAFWAQARASARR